MPVAVLGARQEGGEVLLDGEPFAPASRRESDAAGIAFVNRGCSVGHHVNLADFASIGPGVVLAGQVEVGEAALIDRISLAAGAPGDGPASPFSAVSA